MMLFPCPASLPGPQERRNGVPGRPAKVPGPGGIAFSMRPPGLSPGGRARPAWSPCGSRFRPCKEFVSRLLDPLALEPASRSCFLELQSPAVAALGPCIGPTPCGRVREWGSIGRNGGVEGRPSGRKGTPGTTTGLEAEAEAPGKDGPRLLRNWEGKHSRVPGGRGREGPRPGDASGQDPGKDRTGRSRPKGHRRSAGLGTPEGPRFRTWV
jgi:hypothetical protein